MATRKNKPILATANVPFTPMNNKKLPQKETPYELLKLGDLATPKLNKSNSSSNSLKFDEIKINNDLEIIENNNIIQIKDLLIKALNKIEQLEKEQNKNYNSISTQTSNYNKRSHVKILNENSIKNNNFEEDSTEIKPSNFSSKPFSNNFKSSNSSNNSLNSSSSKNLQERMHQMSIMLKQLENRLENLDPISKYIK